MIRYAFLTLLAVGQTAMAQSVTEVTATAEVITPEAGIGISVVSNGDFGQISASPRHACDYQFTRFGDGELGFRAPPDDFTFDRTTGVFDEYGCGIQGATQIPSIQLSCPVNESFEIVSPAVNVSASRLGYINNAFSVVNNDSVQFSRVSEAEWDGGTFELAVSCGSPTASQPHVKTVVINLMAGIYLEADPLASPEDIEVTYPLEIVY